MLLEDQVCAVQYCRRLNELGVKKNAVYSWANDFKRGFLLTSTTMAHINQKRSKNLQMHYEFHAAFTVAELGQFIPSLLIAQSATQIDRPIIMQKTHENMFCIYIKNENGSIWEFFNDSSEANARAKMLIYLIEQGIVDVSKL